MDPTPPAPGSAGGYFDHAGGLPARSIALWNGSWNNIGNVTAVLAPSSIEALAVLPDGDVVAGGWFNSIGGIAANNVARWDGASWSPFSQGVDSSVIALAFDPRGALWIGGAFQKAGGQQSPHIARIITTCPATAVSTGPGCTGSGGANVLLPRSLPWLGATFEARAFGLPALGLAVHVLGLQPVSLPLASILPHGVPGCSLWASPDLLQVAVPVAGVVDVTITMPTNPAFVGFTIEQQVVALELDAAGAFVAITATNALRLTEGSF